MVLFMLNFYHHTETALEKMKEIEATSDNCLVNYYLLNRNSVLERLYDECENDRLLCTRSLSSDDNSLANQEEMLLKATRCVNDVKEDCKENTETTTS